MCSCEQCMMTEEENAYWEGRYEEAAVNWHQVCRALRVPVPDLPQRGDGHRYRDQALVAIATLLARADNLSIEVEDLKTGFCHELADCGQERAHFRTALLQIRNLGCAKCWDTINEAFRAAGEDPNV